MKRLYLDEGNLREAGFHEPNIALIREFAKFLQAQEDIGQAQDDILGKQPLSFDLTAIDALTGTGIAARTAVNTWALRTLTAPAAGFTITNPAGTAGNPTFVLANDLAALEALSGTDTIYYRSGASAWSAVTVSTGLSFVAGVLTASGGGATLADGDYGDITVSGSGTVLTIDATVVTLAKIQNAAANSKLVGSGAAGSGASYVEITLGSGLAMTGTTLSATGGAGTVTSVSVVTANGVSGSVATATTTPAITLTLGAITPSSVNASGTVVGSNLSGTNTGDQTTIVGISGTKAQFDTACSDGNFLYVGDVTQYTDELAQDAVGAMVDASITYVDATPLLQRAALTGDVTASAGSNATTIAAGAGARWALAGTGQTATGVYDFAVDGAKANIDFIGLSAFNELLVVARGLSDGTSGQRLLRASVDNGGTFYAASGDYKSLTQAGVENASTAFGYHDTASTAVRSFITHILNTKGAAKIAVINASTISQSIFDASASDINAIRILNSGGGNITAGTVRVYGR